MISRTRLALATALLAITYAAPAAAHDRRILASELPDCLDGSPQEVTLLNSSSASTCNRLSTGTAEAHCACLDGAWVAILNASTPIDHGGLTGLADDDHTQHPLLAGRGAQQVLNGGTATGNLLRLQANPQTNATYLDIDDNGSTGYVSMIMGTSAAAKYFFTAADWTFEYGSGVVFQGNTDGTLGTLGRLQIGNVDGLTPTGAACVFIDGSKDKLFGDRDCDDTRDAGEHYLDDGIESLFVGAQEMYTIAGTATPGLVGTLHVYQGLPDSATTEVGGWVPVPASLRGRSFVINLLYAESSVGAACNFRVSSEAKAIAAGTSIGSGGTVSTSSIARPSTSTSNLTAYATLNASFATTSSTVAIAVSVERLGADGNDTCTTVLRVLGLQLEII